MYHILINFGLVIHLTFSNINPDFGHDYYYCMLLVLLDIVLVVTIRAIELKKRMLSNYICKRTLLVLLDSFSSDSKYN